MSNHAKSLEDSHEPMEIEEISYTETPSEVFKPLIIKIEKDLESPADIKPKKILRESKLTKVLKEQKTRAQDPNDDKKTAITSDCSEPQKPTSTDSDNIQKTKPKLPVKEPAEIRPMEEHSWKIIFFILFPVVILVACVSIAREEFGSEICAHRFDPTNAIKDLENRVYGQRKAMRELRSHLTTVSSGLTLLVLTGGTGVGKSYAAHLISENFPSKKNVFQYVQPLKKKLRYASNAISVCGCNLIIVENLNNRDIAEAADFVEYIAGKIDDVNYCVIIIEVINVQVTDENLKREVNLAKSKAEIENIYRDKKLDVKIVQFEHLEDEAVTKCIIDAANSSNLTLSQSEIDDVRISLKISDSGCKGARAKVHLLDKKIGFI